MLLFYFSDTKDYQYLSKLIPPGLLQDMKRIRFFVQCLFTCVEEDLKDKKTDLKGDIIKYFNNELTSSFSKTHISRALEIMITDYSKLEKDLKYNHQTK